MVGIFITARLGSTRLPRKHLILAEGKTMIEWLVLRYKAIFEKELLSEVVRVFLTTSIKQENNAFKGLLEQYGVTVYFGADTNIPKRYFDCAKENALDYFIVVDGDDILCSAYGSYQLYQCILESSNYDIIKVEGLPIGLNSSALKTSYVGECLKKHQNENLEVGWSRIFTAPRTKQIKLGNYEIQGDLRFTLDYEDDARFFKLIISYFGEKIVKVSDLELIDTVVSQKFDQINNHLSREYWVNYNNEIKKQIENNG
jgi:spore coat polysaccharide biosynthesis protein SpsF (cytidylyltransferase family)